MCRGCICGGRFKRCDLVTEQQNGRVFVKDTNASKASWRCDKCSKIVSQRKRIAH